MTNKESADSPQVSWFVFEAHIIVNAAQFNLFEVDNSVYAGYINGQQEIAQQQRNGIVRKYRGAHDKLDTFIFLSIDLLPP